MCQGERSQTGGVCFQTLDGDLSASVCKTGLFEWDTLFLDGCDGRGFGSLAGGLSRSFAFVHWVNEKVAV